MELTMTLHETAGEPITTCMGLAGSATVKDAGELKTALVSALAAADRVLLDVTGVTETDLAILQLLWAARRSAEETGKELALSPAPSGAFQAAILAAGFPSRAVFETGRSSTSREE